MTVTAALLAVALVCAATAAGCWLERRKALRKLAKLLDDMERLVIWPESG